MRALSRATPSGSISKLGSKQLLSNQHVCSRLVVPLASPAVHWL